MSKRKKETVGKIIARILPIKVPEELSDEDAAQFVAQLLGRYDAETVAHLEGVINDLWRGIPPNPDDCRILAGIAETCVLLKRRGGSNKKVRKQELPTRRAENKSTVRGVCTTRSTAAMATIQMRRCREPSATCELSFRMAADSSPTRPSNLACAACTNRQNRSLTIHAPIFNADIAA